MMELKVELEVKRVDVTYKRRRYYIEKRWGSDGSGMFIFYQQRLIYSSWNQEVNTKEGLEVEQAYLNYQNEQRRLQADPSHWS